MPDPHPHSCGERLIITDADATYVPSACPEGIRQAHLHVPADAPRACAPICPARGTEHVHPWPEGRITPEVVREAIRAEIRGGNYSQRGIAKKLRALGVTRPDVRAELWRLVPEYMRDQDARHGPHRITGDHPK